MVLTTVRLEIRDLEEGDFLAVREQGNRMLILLFNITVAHRQSPRNKRGAIFNAVLPPHRNSRVASMFVQ